MKSFKEIRSLTENAPVNALGGGNIGGTIEAGNFPPVRKRKDKPKVIRRKFAQNEVFVVKSGVYNSCIRPKTRHERFERHVGCDEVGMAIREYAKNNPGKAIMIEDENTGHMTYLRLPR